MPQPSPDDVLLAQGLVDGGLVLDHGFKFLGGDFLGELGVDLFQSFVDLFDV